MKCARQTHLNCILYSTPVILSQVELVPITFFFPWQTGFHLLESIRGLFPPRAAFQASSAEQKLWEAFVPAPAVAL